MSPNESETAVSDSLADIMVNNEIYAPSMNKFNKIPPVALQNKDQQSLKLAFLFSMKAVIPSLLSSVAKVE